MIVTIELSELKDALLEAIPVFIEIRDKNSDRAEKRLEEMCQSITDIILKAEKAVDGTF